MLFNKTEIKSKGHFHLNNVRHLVAETHFAWIASWIKQCGQNLNGKIWLKSKFLLICPVDRDSSDLCHKLKWLIELAAKSLWRKTKTESLRSTVVLVLFSFQAFHLNNNNKNDNGNNNNNDNDNNNNNHTEWNQMLSQCVPWNQRKVEPSTLTGLI